MRIITLISALFLLIAFPGYATDITGGADPLEKRYIKDSRILPDLSKQSQIRAGNAWKTFRQKHKNWYVSFDERSGMPHRATGTPISTGASNAMDASGQFISEHLSLFLAEIPDLKLQTQNFSGKYHNVFYIQQYRGLDILNSRVFVKLTPDFKVSTFGFDVFDIRELSVEPVISAPVISAIATGNLGLTVEKNSEPVLRILPLPVSGQYDYRLVYEVMVHTRTENNVPGAYYTLLDANTGELIYRQNRVRYSHAQAIDASVTGSVSLYSPFDPAVVMPLPNLMVEDGSNLLYTDSLGEVNIPSAGAVNATFTLAGKWSSIFTDGGSVSPSITSLFDPGTLLISFDSATTLSHVSGYYHVNVIHDFMKSYFPSFPILDFSLPTQIDLTSGSCNAFYSGSDINFYESAGGCHSMAEIGDVVYHEYGHGINDKFYQWQGANWDNGAMGEGYADVWGFSITQIPIVGNGYRTNNANSFIRRYDQNRKVYPQDLVGQVHDDGEIIAGAWYDVSLNLGSWSAMTELFASTYFDLVTGPDGNEGQIYADILLSALNHDDDDADLSNGTPNDSAILAAFELHGITLLNSVDIVHNDLSSSAKNTAIVINAVMAAQFPWYSINVFLNYRTTGSGSFSSIPMTDAGGGNFTASIPGQPAGTIITYYLESRDGVGTSLSTNPPESNISIPNIPYYILVDFDRIQMEDFDSNQSPGWLTSVPGDDATSGFWIIDTPVPSFQSGGILCQTGLQHTPGGFQCAITGNAASSTASVGNNDVDGGKTTLESPLIDLSAYTIPVVSYWRWYSNDQGSTPRTDFWRTYASADGVNYVALEDLDVPDHEWRRFAFKVHEYFPGATQISLRFVADDDGSGSIIEAAIDDVEFLDVLSNVSVNDIPDNIKLSLYPNPAGAEVTLSFVALSAEKGSLEVFNSIGQSVLAMPVELSKGRNVSVIPTAGLADGIYRLVLRTGSSASVIQLAVLNGQ
jgi:hypothetical protein